MPKTFRAPLVVVLACAVGFLAACGGGSSSDAKATLKKAFSTPIGSAKIDLEITLDLNGIKQLNGPVKLSVQGPYESGGKQTIPKADWDIAASAAGQNFSAGFISTGTNAWVSFQGQSYEVGQQAVAQINQQIQTAAKNNKSKGLSEFGIDPENWLSDAKDEGTATVNGVETDHVSAKFDVGKFLDDVNTLVSKAGNLGTTAPQLSESQKKQIENVVENPQFDVYVGKSDSVIRRLAANISFNVPKNKQSQIGGLQSGNLQFSIDFTDVGKPQTITAPTNAKPLSDLTSQLGGLGSVLGGATGGTSGGTGTSGGPSAASLQKYSQCLQKADPSKPAQLQKCAALLK